MKFLLPVIAILAFLTVSANRAVASHDEDPDHAAYHLTTAAWITANGDNRDTEDRWVVLCGKVTKKLDSETYLFDDGTGTIQLDSEDHVLPLDTPIVVRGRIDQDYSFFGKLEVDIRSWRHIVAGDKTAAPADKK